MLLPDLSKSLEDPFFRVKRIKLHYEDEKVFEKETEIDGLVRERHVYLKRGLLQHISEIFITYMRLFKS